MLHNNDNKSINTAISINEHQKQVIESVPFGKIKFPTNIRRNRKMEYEAWSTQQMVKLLNEKRAEMYKIMLLDSRVYSTGHMMRGWGYVFGNLYS